MSHPFFYNFSLPTPIRQAGPTLFPSLREGREKGWVNKKKMRQYMCSIA